MSSKFNYAVPSSYAPQSGFFSGPKENPAPPSSSNGRFSHVNRPVYQDWWATVLFIINFGGYCFLSYLGLSFWAQNGLSGKSGSGSVDANGTATSDASDRDNGMLVAILIVCSFIGLVISGAYYKLLERYPLHTIWATFFISIAIDALLAFAMIANGNFFGAAVFILFALVAAVSLYMSRHRIPLAALTAETVCGIIKKYPSTLAVAFVSLWVQIGYSIWWACSLVGIYARYQDNSGAAGGIALFLVFSYYWTTQVLQNTVYVTLCGVFGSFYFLEGTAAMPSHPVSGAARRAYTSSLGPICFGSLIVAILELFMYLLREMSRQHSFVAAIAHCIIGCIKGMIEYLNAFAYVEVAIYGKGFCQAAKDAWQVITGSGFGVLASNLFVGRALGVAIFTTGFITTTVAYVWSMAVFTPGSMAYQNSAIVSLICFAFGMMSMWTVAKTIDAGVRTILVCVAEDPMALQRTKPELYAAFKQNFPEIAWRV